MIPRTRTYQTNFTIHVDSKIRIPRRFTRTLEPGHRSPRRSHDQILFLKGDSQRVHVLNATGLSAKKRSIPPRHPPLEQPQKCTEQAGKKSGKGSKPTKGRGTRSIKSRPTSSFEAEASFSG